MNLEVIAVDILMEMVTVIKDDSNWIEIDDRNHLSIFKISVFIKIT